MKSDGWLYFDEDAAFINISSGEYPREVGASIFISRRHGVYKHRRRAVNRYISPIMPRVDEYLKAISILLSFVADHTLNNIICYFLLITGDGNGSLKRLLMFPRRPAKRRHERAAGFCLSRPWR